MTVFGVTLTRQQTVVGVAILVAVLLLLGLVVPLLFAGGDDDKGAAGPTATAGKPAQTGGVQPPPKQGKTTPPSVAPSSAPRTTAASSAPGAKALPKGWRTYGNASTGFTVPIPENASIDARNPNEIEFRWNNRLLLLAQTNSPADPLEDWKNQERTRSGGKYRDYQRIKMVPVDYFQESIDWEFFYTTVDGNRQHAMKRNIVVSSKRAFSINWYTTPEDWDAAKKDLQVLYDGFKPM
ncbi:hypothetical protein Asp14428_55090 [Actinoplanes sp. NBRC 14428]|nr:hypothetical protein Asp14428_55090 [Actinoplanes sp. NBRC 14428]